MARRVKGEMRIQRNGVNGRGTVQRRVVRKDGWSEAMQARFLEVLRATANVSEASRACGMKFNGAYRLRARDPGFAAAWQEALEQGYAELEMMLIRQSLFGTERTELVREGGARHGPVKATKTVHSFPLGVAVRLHLAHREKVDAYRARRGIERPDDAAVIERVRQAMADIRARVLSRHAPSAE